MGAAQSAGWKPLCELALGRILRGDTTIEEIVRIGLVAQPQA
jgi:hypothetical protein